MDNKDFLYDSLSLFLDIVMSIALAIAAYITKDYSFMWFDIIFGVFAAIALCIAMVRYFYLKRGEKTND